MRPECLQLWRNAGWRHMSVHASLWMLQCFKMRYLLRLSRDTEVVSALHLSSRLTIPGSDC